MASVQSAQPPSLPLIALLMLAFGCEALVFQVARARDLLLVFGATTAAAAAVLAIFMAGLGLGSAVLGKRADRVANPLRMYGILEVVVARCVAGTPRLVELGKLDLLRRRCQMGRTSDTLLSLNRTPTSELSGTGPFL